MPCHHDGHKSLPWTMNGGSRQFSSPPCMFFFPFFQNFFYTNVNFLIKWTTSSYATTNSSTLTSWPCQRIKMALAQHKNTQMMVHTIVWASDMPTTSATSPRRPLITTINDEWGLETHLEPSCMFFSCFISFFFYTNMNFLLNRHHHPLDWTGL